MAVRHPISSSHNRSNTRAGPDAPNISADYGFVPLQQSARRIEEAVAIATLAVLAPPPGPGALHLGDSGWSATPAAVAASKGRAISFGGR
jgi:hypothetical protein